MFDTGLGTDVGRDLVASLPEVGSSAQNLSLSASVVSALFFLAKCEAGQAVDLISCLDYLFGH